MANILVVEDDVMNAKLFDLLLSRKGGHDVKIAKDADEAVELGLSPGTDLIIMDVSLQNWVYQGKEVDGIDLTRLIRQRQLIGHTPVLLATAHAMKGDKEKFLEESGAEDYFAKPIGDHASFLAKVTALLKTVGVG